ncbi:MAG: hypothetical protein JO352_01635 [Chloroflexi bacterium]|nr:hypothetical protein [Chloroflexota bacterium]
MARQRALIAAWTCHVRGIIVGVRACHQNTSASTEPLKVGLPKRLPPFDNR